MAPVSDEASAATYHIEGHDDHEIDADASAGGGELPVLLHKIQVDGGKLLHGDETENHHGKHGGQDEGNLNRHDGGREMRHLDGKPSHRDTHILRNIDRSHIIFNLKSKTRAKSSGSLQFPPARGRRFPAADFSKMACGITANA